MEPRLAIEGKAATSAFLHVPQRGLWTVDLDLAEDLAFSGRVTVRVGELELVGTVDGDRSGFYRSGALVRVVAGAGGWERPAPRRHWHADQGVKRSTVLQDTARVQGETLELDAGVDGVIGVDFLRQDKDGDERPIPASLVFARTGAPVWWVDYAGVTHVARVRPPAARGDVELLDYDVRAGVAELADVAPVQVGSTLVIDGVEHVVRELRVHATAQRTRTRVQLVDVVANRLYDAIATIARQVQAERIGGLTRYRVFQMSVHRVELQVVDKTLGLPDALPVSMWPGLAGVWARLQPGAVVLVEFIEGSATRPIVTHFEPREGAGFLPIEVLVDATDVLHLGPSAAEIRIGGDDGAAVHRVGDAGTAGTLTIASIPSPAPPGSGLVITHVAPDGTPTVVTLTGAVTVAPDPAVIALPTQATEGSERLTSE